MKKPFNDRPGKWNGPRLFRWSREIHKDGNVVVWKLSRRIGINIVSVQVALSQYEIYVSKNYAAQRLRDARKQLTEFANA